MNDSQKLDLILDKINSVDARLEGVDARLDEMDARFDRIDARLDEMDARFDRIDVRLDEMDARFDRIDTKIEDLELEVRAIKFIIENEISRNVKIIAEGHLDLSRKLSETIKIASDIEAKQEMQDIYLNMHESKLRAL